MTKDELFIEFQREVHRRNGEAEPRRQPLEPRGDRGLH